MKKNVFLILLIACFQVSLAQKTIEIDDAKPLTWQGKAALGGYSPEGTLEIDKKLGMGYQYPAIVVQAKIEVQ